MTSEDIEELDHLKKQILLDLSSLTRNVVGMNSRTSSKVLKKSGLISNYKDVLYSERVGVR